MVAIQFEERANAQESEITGKVIHIYRSTENWSAGILSAESNGQFYIDNDVRFSVDARIELGERITLHGSWTNHPKFGSQFKASSINYPMPDMSAAGLADYLAHNPAFRGIGPAKAQAISDAFRDRFDQAIRETPHIVQAAAKLTDNQIDILRSEWIARADVNAIATWLASFGLTHCQIKKIAERYGNQAKQVLEENPYVLADELHGYGFARTDEIAIKMGMPKDHPGRIRACLIDLVKSESDEGGHTWIDRKQLVKQAVAKLAFDTLSAEQLIRDQLATLCEADLDGDTLPRLVDIEYDSNHLIALRSIYNREIELLNWFTQSVDQKPQQVCSFCLGNAIENLITNHGFATPNTDQMRSIKMAVNSRISVMSGGAGTGKSFTIATIYRLFTDWGKSVAMCAPTGKAAKRMSSLAQGAFASTIHKLLEYDPVSGEFAYGKSCKLPDDLIIVDEVSMCDINLLWHLFSAIDLQRTQVLLVGDHNQLPPIGAGNVLRDVLAHNILPDHILTECIRAAGELKLNCNAILAGEIKPSTTVLPAGGREWRLIDNLEDTEKVIESLRMLYSGKLESWGFDPISECQIITPYNKGKLGVNRINAELQRIWQLRKFNKQLPEVPTDKETHTRFYVGDKVMQIKNDYKLGSNGVMNGTQGVVRWMGVQGSKAIMTINFDDEPGVNIEVGSDQEKNIVLAYACTIHKVQGSEYPCVVSIIHRQHSYMLSRNLIYTAATRARKTAILIGDKIGMRRAARTTAPIERRTWMGLV